jgi:nicotinamide-nucleotide amidase
MEEKIIVLATELGTVLQAKGIKMVTAESCTGGGIAQAITDIPGSSVWFDRGFVSYSNLAKIQMLGVKRNTISDHGAVSSEVALEMVTGALNNSTAELAVAVTGIAGPTGGTEQKPVGTVYIAWQLGGQNGHWQRLLFSGNRMEIRKQTIEYALKACLDLVALGVKTKTVMF